MNRIVSASILSADLCNLEKEIVRAERAGCEYIHFDVMDGVFVNNISYGIPVLKSVSKVASAILDVHLMIINPLKYIKDFSDAGADIITFHYEADSDCADTINAIHSFGKKAGISIKPGTPVNVLLPYLNSVDMILIMTVEPGFGGQGFISETLDKVSELKRIINEKKVNIPIQVDGGINEITALKAANAGAEIMVAGSFLFNSEDMGRAVRALR